MERSVTGAFGAQHCINCMCHPLENLYAYYNTTMARASEDFYPRDPASHTLHVANVAYNSLFLGEIVVPDWDMFQSANAVATLHAVARAVGGCSVYISDHPGEHDFSLLRRIVLPSGEVLRAQQPGKPTRDTLFADVTRDGVTACKIWNVNAAGAGVVAAFNLQGYHWDRVSRCMRANDPSGAPAPHVTAHVGPADYEPAVAAVEEGVQGGRGGEREGGRMWAVLQTQWSVDGALKHRDLALMSYAERRCVCE